MSVRSKHVTIYGRAMSDNSMNVMRKSSIIQIINFSPLWLNIGLHSITFYLLGYPLFSLLI